MSTSTTPSLSQATAELIESKLDFDEKLGAWWKFPPHVVGAACVRWVHARHALRRAITEPAESRAS